MLKRHVYLSLTMLIGLILIIALPTQAADFSVSTAQELIDAINTANANTEADTITLTADITLTAVDNNADFVDNSGVAGSDGNNDGANGLPLITSEITLEGDTFTIARDGSAPDFRLFVVVGSGILSLNNVTISNGSTIDSSPATFDNRGGGIINLGIVTLTNSTLSDNSATNGGGIFNQGTLTLNNSTLSSNSATDFGGGIYNFGRTVTLNNSTLSDNSAGNGGGIFNQGTVSLNNSTLSNNSAVIGGGIYNQSTLTLNSSSLSDNSATNTGGGIFNQGTVTLNNSTLSDNSSSNGGGIYHGFGTVMTINNSTLSNNSATNGGGIFNQGTVTLNNSTLSDNSATNTGGGIYHADGALTLNNSTLSDNSATNNGGGIFNRRTVILNNSTLSDNSATNDGGGIYNQSTLTLNNSTLSGNSATNDGGGIYNDFRVTTLNNSTLSGNSATNDGGGIYNDFGTVNLNNSIIANSTSGSDYDGSASTITGTNIVEDGSVAGATSGDPNLGALGNNGGPTPTHALLAGSPAIDNTSGTATTSDQRGASAVGTRDIGAYEFDGTVPTVSFTVDEATLTEFGAITQATVTITVANFSAPFDVSFAFAGTVDSSDYTTSYSSPITINGNGDTTFTVDIVGDAISESTETLDLTLLIQGSADVVAPSMQTVNFIDGVPPVVVPPEEDPIINVPDIGIFDPALSKIGFLVPGETGVVGEQLEWVTTVTNNGTLVGNNITIIDNVNPQLQVNSVDAPNATVTINGNSVSITYATLNVGQRVQFSIFTTVLEGVTVDNTVCIEGTDICATGTAVAQLPSTGETPLSRMIALLVLSGIVVFGIFGFIKLTQQTEPNDCSGADR